MVVKKLKYLVKRGKMKARLLQLDINDLRPHETKFTQVKYHMLQSKKLIEQR